MSPSLHVNLDPESFNAAQEEAAGWVELLEDGAVTEPEAREMIREIAQDVKIEVKLT